MNVLVTGVSSGIGRAICETLVREGHRVIGTARAHKRHTTDFELLPLELTRRETIDALVNTIEKQGFEPDVLINNAGMGGFGAVDPEIQLDPKTGQITWSEKMAVGNHHLTISATNQAGVTTTDFKLNKSEPKIPFDFGYRPDHMTS